MRVSWQRTEKDPQRPHEARSRDWSDAATSQGLSRVVRRLVSRTEGECVFLVRSRHIGSPLLRRPQETSASCTCIRSSMPTATPGGRIPTPAFWVRKGGLRAAERDPPVDVATNRTQRAIALLPPWKTIPNKGQRNIATEQDGRTDGRKAASSPGPPRLPPGLRCTDGHKPRGAGRHASQSEPRRPRRCPGTRAFMRNASPSQLRRPGEAGHAIQRNAGKAQAHMLTMLLLRGQEKVVCVFSGVNVS